MAAPVLARADDLPPSRTAKRMERPPLDARLIPLGYGTNRLRDIHLDSDADAWTGANEPDRNILVVHLKTGR